MVLWKDVFNAKYVVNCDYPSNLLFRNKVKNCSFGGRI